MMALVASNQPTRMTATCSCPPIFPPIWCRARTYYREGMPRGLGGKGRCLAPRGRAGIGAGPLASLHGHVEELKLEEPGEERAIALQQPGNKKVMRRCLGPCGT